MTASTAATTVRSNGRPNIEKEPDSDDGVVRQCRDGTCRELPLEANHDVNEDQEQRDDHSERTALGQFATHLCTDGFDAA